MIDIQPPPHECQFCGVDLDVAHHKLTCRIVVDIGGIEGWLDIPVFLDRRKAKGAVPVETEGSSVFD